MLDHAEYIARQSNEAAAELTSMGTVMNRVRYGGDTLDPQTITAVRTSLVRFQSALQTSRTRPTARLRTSGDSATD
jgi:hypothetical protein